VISERVTTPVSSIALAGSIFSAVVERGECPGRAGHIARASRRILSRRKIKGRCRERRLLDRSAGCNKFRSAINPRRHAVRRQVLRLHFRRQRFGLRYRSAMASPIRLCGEPAFGLLFAYLTIVTGRWLFGRKAL
jgi:hypothetical protein